MTITRNPHVPTTLTGLPSPEQARAIGEAIGVDWNGSPFDIEEFRCGLQVELEHGRRDPATNVTDNHPLLTGKIALAHLKEFPDYYARLTVMEREAEAYWAGNRVPRWPS